jgi:hypothetical protein
MYENFAGAKQTVKDAKSHYVFIRTVFLLEKVLEYFARCLIFTGTSTSLLWSYKVLLYGLTTCCAFPVPLVKG